MTDRPDYRVAYPFQAHLGFRKTAFADGVARFELPLGPHLTNRVGLPHGGVYAALLDTALGASGCWRGDPNDIAPAVTLTLTVNFLAPPRGVVLLAEGRRVGGGRRIYFAEGEVRDEADTLIATATGSFRLVRARAGG